MKLLVIQEQHFTRMPNGEVWVDEQSDAKFWQRYLNVFEEIVVCARFTHRNIYDTSGLIRSDCPNVSFIVLPNSRGVGSLLKVMPRVINIMKKAMSKCDRIIFRAPSPISMVAYPLARMSGKPYAAEIMNNPYTLFSPESMHHFYQPLLRHFIVRQTKSLCLHANGVSYVTENVLQELYPCRARKEGPSQKYFEGNYSTIRMEPERFSFDVWSDDRPAEITLIHTGKMQDHRKGQDIFIKTIDILRQKGYNVNGILVGEGEMRPVFEQLGRDLGLQAHLDFVGWKAGFEAVKAELKRAQIAVLPTLGEGLPRSVIEAMAQGLLCFGSKVDGICELLEGQCLVEKFTAECFAEHIEYFLERWELVRPMREKQFQNSLKYESSILEEKRNRFYQNLRTVK